jgi:hypothetical protein
VVVTIVVTVALIVLLPLLAFVAELAALPFIALVLRGNRVVEARNETTGERIRRRARGREAIRRAERELAEQLQTAPLEQDAVRVLSR